MITVLSSSKILSGPTTWGEVALAAWACRENAHIIGKTAVGAAVITHEGITFLGCNVEHQFRSHDVHAEVNAITTMIAAGHRRIGAVIVVAERDRFTPCGACMDWIFQFGDGSSLIAFQRVRDGELELYTAGELMPYYPK